MSTNVQWEYQIEVYGSIWRSPKPEEIQEFLNDLGELGWEVINLHHPENSNKVWITVKRPLTDANRCQRRREREWEFN